MDLDLFSQWIKDIYYLFIENVIDIDYIRQCDKNNKIVCITNDQQVIQFTPYEFMHFFHHCFLSIDINIILGAFTKLENGKRSNNLIYYWLLKNEEYLEAINKNQSLSKPLTLKSMKEQYNKYINELTVLFELYR